MLIAICVVIVSVTQIAGLWLIAKALGQPQIESESARESAKIHPTLSSDVGGLV